MRGAGRIAARPPLASQRAAAGWPDRNVPSLHCIVAPGGALAGLALGRGAALAAIGVTADGRGGGVWTGKRTSTPRCDAQPDALAGATMNVPSTHCATALAGGAIEPAVYACRLVWRQA